MCKEVTIIPRKKIDDNQSEEKNIIKQVSFDEQSKMLCNVIVRATQELYVNQQKTQNEIEIYLKNDCQQLSTSELIQKVE